MFTIKDKYPTIVGQTSVLKKLNFFSEIQNSTGFFPPVLLTGSRGAGKNSIATALIRNIKTAETKSEKQAVEINSSSIESLDDFYNNIVDILIVGKEISLIMDEFHAISKVPDLLDTFLTIFNTNNLVNTIKRNGLDYAFDKSKISWICLTSEPHLLPETLLSRLEVIQLEALTQDELAEIIQKNLNGIEAEKETIADVASVARNNGRESFKLAENIYNHLKRQGKRRLTKEEWLDIKSQLGVRKFGINNVELKIMQYLQKHPQGVSLSKLSSALMLTADSTRLGFERFLLGNDFIAIEAGKGRTLTSKGKLYLEEVKD